MWKCRFGGARINRPGRRHSRRVRLVERNGFERLDRRILPTVTATFADLAGELRILGDAGDNTIVVSRDAAGTISVNHGDIAIQGGVPTVANTHEIFMNGQAGNDSLSLDETNGPLPGAALFGGDGNDTLIGGSGEDFADGGAGNDTVLLGAGDDTFEWDPGDGSDTIDGQGGADTMQFNGSTAAEHIDISASGRHVLFNRDLGGVAMDLVGVETINFSAMGDGDIINVDDQTSTDLSTVNLDLARNGGTNDGQPDSIVVNGTEGADTVQVQPTDGTGVTVTGLFPVVNITGAAAISDNLTVNALGGDDLVDASALPANLIGLVLNGGAGSDLLIGSQGPDLVIGGPGDDSADLGDGGDAFAWNPGDGSDGVDGQGGSDRLVFNGSDVAENFGISADGNRARLMRDVGGVAMDLVGIETIDVHALGGADTVAVNDLSETDVTAVDANLAGSAGGGDGQIDSVVVNGTEGDDTVQIQASLDASRIFAEGLHAMVRIIGAEATSDNLTVNALGGDDTVNASLLSAVPIGLALNGGAGTDTIFGSKGADLVNGGPGNDTADLGAGDDTFVWNPGDGSDEVDGQGGSDRLVFNGSNVAENFVLSANGSSERLTRDVGGVALDLGGIETIDVNALGGADTVTVNDLSGTEVTAVDVNLAGSAGGGDGQIDSVTVNGTDGADNLQVLPSVDGTRITAIVNFLPLVRITGVDGADDTLTVNALGGDDRIDASLLPADLIGLILNGGAGTDTIFGSQGNDVVNGGPGNDNVLLQAGDDTFVWNPGDGSDEVDGQGGSDRLVFNGSNVAENFVLSANGNQARLTRDVGGVAMDLSGIETVDVNALGGADTNTVNDLSGTDVIAVDVNLAGSAGGGDGQSDSDVVNGTDGSDNIQVLPTGNGTGISVAGLHALVNITGAEGTNDHLTVNALGGDDVLDASLLASNLIGLSLNGGDGNNTIVGDTSTFSVVSSLPTSTFGQAVSFTATVNPTSGGPIPTGTVQFVVDGTNFGGPVPLAGGSATSAPLGNLGAGSHTILARYSGDGNYAANTDHLTQAINKAHLTVTADPKSDRFGDALPALTATISGFVNGDGLDVVGGSPGLTTAATSASRAGTYTIMVAAGTLSAANYDFPNLVNGTLIVNKATPMITWANPADITFGTALGSAQLDAAASIPGTFAYTPAKGTILDAGQQRTLTATFTPDDTTDYNTITATASINVLNAVSPAPAPHATGIVAASHTRKGLVSITAAFDEALNPNFLNSLSSFSVLGGVRKHGKTVFSKSVLVNGFHYDDTAHTVTITLAKPFKGVVKATIRPGVVAANGASSSVGFTAIVK